MTTLHYVYLVEESVDGSGTTTTKAVFSNQEQAEQFVQDMGQWSHYYSVRAERLLGSETYVKETVQQQHLGQFVLDTQLI